MAPNLINVEVAYAEPTHQHIVKLQVQNGSTIQEVIQRSNILILFPQIKLASQAVGVFGKLRELTDAVYEGDRVEIYRPLLLDPKEARKLKAGKGQKNK